MYKYIYILTHIHYIDRRTIRNRGRILIALDIRKFHFPSVSHRWILTWVKERSSLHPGDCVINLHGSLYSIRSKIICLSLPNTNVCMYVCTKRVYVCISASSLFSFYLIFFPVPLIFFWCHNFPRFVCWSTEKKRKNK